jgi:thiol:disulfide interchange protein DsbA
MKKFLSAFFLSLGLIANVAHASPTAPVAGTDYLVLNSPQPIDSSTVKMMMSFRKSADTPVGKIEVTEFFWYGCPHCSEFNPLLEAWVKKQGPDVIFKRVPVAFDDRFKPHSKMFHALDELGLADKLTPIVFREIHENHNYLMTEQAQIDFLSKNGVDPQKYKAAYDSFSANSLLQRDAKLMTDYKIDGVPTLAIQGKYETSPAQANGSAQTLQVLDYLVAQIRAKKL